MHYDFDTRIDRTGTGSLKWDRHRKFVPEDASDFLPLSIADMEFPTAPAITQALTAVVERGVYGYTIPTDSYIAAVSEWMLKRHNWMIESSWIVPFCGVVPALYNAIRAITHPGDKVVVQPPAYPPFYSAVTSAGCQVVRNPLLNDAGHYRFDFDDLEEKVSDPRVRALILCNPHNPTGRVWSERELRELGRICIEHDVLVLSDEIHFDFVFPPSKHQVFAALSDEFALNSITFTAPSKTFNLAGLETSNIIIPNPDLREDYTIAAENALFMPLLNIFGYTACEAAYRHGEEWLDQLLTYLEGNARFVADFCARNLPDVVVSPLEGTYLLWLDFRPLGLTSQELERVVTQRAHLKLDEGYTFGVEGAGFERINLACPRSMLKTAMYRLSDALNSAKSTS